MPNSAAAPGTSAGFCAKVSNKKREAGRIGRDGMHRFPHDFSAKKRRQARFDGKTLAIRRLRQKTTLFGAEWARFFKTPGHTDAPAASKKPQNRALPYPTGPRRRKTGSRA